MRMLKRKRETPIIIAKQKQNTNLEELEPSGVKSRLEETKRAFAVHTISNNNIINNAMAWDALSNGRYLLGMALTASTCEPILMAYIIVLSPYVRLNGASDLHSWLCSYFYENLLFTISDNELRHRKRSTNRSLNLQRIIIQWVNFVKKRNSPVVNITLLLSCFIKLGVYPRK